MAFPVQCDRSLTVGVRSLVEAPPGMPDLATGSCALGRLSLVAWVLGDLLWERKNHLTNECESVILGLPGWRKTPGTACADRSRSLCNHSAGRASRL
jgi:hypothetical protein